MTAPAIPPDPRIGRQRVLAIYLRVALAVVFVTGCLAAVIPDDLGERGFGVAMVVVLIVAPVGRVTWLLVRWLCRGDRRFALAAGLLLLVMLAALLLGR